MAEQIRQAQDLFGAQNPEVTLPEDLTTLFPGWEYTADQLDLTELNRLAAAHPKDSGVWASLARYYLEQGQPVVAYAAARTGYHRGLDALRSNGWRGAGRVPWSHEPNRGVLYAIAMLSEAAKAIGEEDEVIRCLNLLHDSDASAAGQLGLS